MSILCMNETVYMGKLLPKLQGVAMDASVGCLWRHLDDHQLPVDEHPGSGYWGSTELNIDKYIASFGHSLLFSKYWTYIFSIPFW